MKNSAASLRAAPTPKVAGHRLEPGTIPLLITLGLGVFAGALDLNVLSPALPALSNEFGITAREASFTLTIYLLANVAAIPVASKLADRLGRRRIYITCLAIFAIGSLIAIIAPIFPVLLLGRAIQAIGAGGIFPVATAAIADRVPPERRGGALGILGAIWGLAGIVGPILGGCFTSALSWRWIFILNLPLSVLVIFLARKHLPKAAPNKRGPLDVQGLSLLTAGLIALVIALTHIDPAVASLGSARDSIVAIIVAVAAFSGLLYCERKASEPVISPKLISKREIRITYLLELFIGALEGSLFFVPTALYSGQHLPAAALGAIAAVGALVFVGVIPLAGKALDRIGARSVLSVGALTSAAGLVLFAFGYHSLLLAMLSMIVAGAGFGALLGAPTRYIVSQEAPPEQRSTAIGLLSIFLIIGQLVGTSLAGGLMGSQSATFGGFKMLYLVFASLGIAAFIVTRFLAPRKGVA